MSVQVAARRYAKPYSDRMKRTLTDHRCGVCGKRLNLMQVQHKCRYCSPPCGHAAPLVRPLTHCILCGAALAPKARGPIPRYCSKQCSDLHNKQRRQDVESDRTCDYCGRRLNVWQADNNRRFCSPECYTSSRRTLKGTMRECVICSGEFEPHYKGQQCCGQECSVVKRIATLRAKCEETARCCTCGISFIALTYPNALNIDAERRCPTCQYLHERGYDRARCAKRREKVGPQLSYDAMRRDVFERDQWICQLCGEPVNSACSYPDPMSASLDHIIPLGRGGPHTVENAQLAHWVCNVAKGCSLEAGTGA